MTAHFPPQTLKESVFAAICFFDLFDYPLSLREIHRFLLTVTVSEKELFDFLEKHENIDYKAGYYFLPGREEIVKARFVNNKVAQKYWAKVKFYLPFIQLIPYVRMVAICNTLAFNNPTKDSDIDLFIVTEKERIFLTRTLVTLLFSFLGIRRNKQKIAGRFCLSFFVSNNSLNLKSIQIGEEDIYLLYWLMTLHPVYGQKIYQDFLSANEWVSNYFPYHFNINKEIFWSENLLLKFWKVVIEKILNLGPGIFLEKKLHKFQLKRHHRNSKNLNEYSNVVLNEKMLKFHNVDRRKEYAEKFRKSYERFL